MPKISVIVPIYKVEKYLMECIDSILNQTLKDIEVLLIDEGDIDACRCIIDYYAAKDNRVIAIHEKNGGYGPSCNKGLDRAVGEYISIIESDDFIAPEMFEEMYNYAKKLDADVVKTPYYEYWEKSKCFDEISKLCFWHNFVEDVPENKCFSIAEQPILFGIHPSVWSCIYKKEYVDKYNIRFLEDKGAYVDQSFKIVSLLNTNKIAWLNKPYYYYRLSNVDASASNYNLPAMIRRWRDVHKLIKNDFQSSYDKIVSYNFAEEFCTTYEKILFEGFNLTEEDAEILKENLCNTTLEQVKAAKVIKKFKLDKMIDLKKHPDKLKKYVKESEGAVLNILGLPIFKVCKVKRNTWKAYLFSKLMIFKLKVGLNRRVLYLFGFIPVVKLEGKA